MKRKWLIIGMLSALGILAVHAEEGVTFYLNTGSKVSFAFSEHPVVKLSGDELTISVAGSSLEDKEELGKYRKVVNGHIFVNLGLPSGLYWATCNVGAETETDYGNYYAWGETTTKSSYTSDNSTWCGRLHSGDLTPSEDAATANWGKGTRMPTRDEMEELINNCTWEWQKNYNNTSVNGYLVTGSNSQSVFFPAAGSRRGPYLHVAGSYGDYWTSSPYSDDDRSYYLNFYSGDVYSNYDYERGDGRSVRAVCQ